MRTTIWCGLLVGLVCIQSADAEVTRFEITQRNVIAGGKSFGDRGPYVHLVGRVHFAIVPELVGLIPFGGRVVDLQYAPRNADGHVEFWADFEALTPQDPARSNHAVLYDVNNRGNKLALGMFCYGGGNDLSKPEAVGDGFLLRQGFTIVWSGWDGELLPGGNRLLLNAPIARGEHGPITGPVRCEVIVNEPAYRTVVNWANHGSYRPVPGLIEQATLTIREKPADPRVELPRDQWTLHVSEVDSPNPTQLPKVELEVPAGLKPGSIYELIYTAQDPLVMGVGFVGVRDLMAAIRDGQGGGNPFLLANHVDKSYLGRFLREFLQQGFNADHHGGPVIDAVIPHVAGGGLGSFNHRFAQPTRHTNQHDHHDYPGDRFPFAYERQTDPLSGLSSQVGSEEDCLVLHTQSSAEYWTRAGSLPHTDPLGRRDAKPPSLTRFYTFGGTQHGPAGYPPERGLGQNASNPGDYKPFLRALLMTVIQSQYADQWLRAEEFPPSIVPRINDGTLLPWRDALAGFPKIPGVKTPNVIHEPLWLFHGDRWHTERIIDVQPPRVLGSYRVLAPRVDPDGNDLGCLLPPEVAVPVGTYTGWNLRRATAGAEDELVSLTGSFLPFPVTKADREQTSDPRPSLQERYGTHAEYVRRFTAECQRLQAAGWLIPEDAERLPKLHADRTRTAFAKFDDAAKK
jgi:hypothetical protein